MLGDSGFGPPPRRRGSGNVLTHIITAVLGAALAMGLLLSFYSPGSGGLPLPGSGAVPAPASPAAPLASSAGVIGMDTAGNDAGSQQAATGFAIPVNTALSVARQIAGGRASSTITIGYPPFMGIFLASGSASSPQAQAHQQEQQNGGFGSSQACYTSNSDLTVPSAIAPVSSGTLILGTICGSPAAQAGMTGGAVITAVNGQAVGSPDDLTGILARFHPGDTISVTWVSPSGQRTTSSLHLAAGPPQ